MSQDDSKQWEHLLSQENNPGWSDLTCVRTSPLVPSDPVLPEFPLIRRGVRGSSYRKGWFALYACYVGTTLYRPHTNLLLDAPPEKHA